MDTLRDSPQDLPPSAVLRGTGAALAGQGGHLPWWRRITIPFEVLIATVVFTAMLLLTALLVYQVSTSARQAIIAASDESAQRISQLIAERVHRIVEPADATIRLLAFDPVASASSLPARLRRLPVLARLLEQNQLLSTVFIGYPDGQFLLVRPVRNEALRVRPDAVECAVRAGACHQVHRRCGVSGGPATHRLAACRPPLRGPGAAVPLPRAPGHGAFHQLHRAPAW